MIIEQAGSIFDAPAKVLVCPVNTVGVMGKGLALQFKQRYPEMYAQYRRHCASGALTIGRLWLYKPPTKDGQWVLCFPTKKDWRDPSQVLYIGVGLEKFAKTYAERGITSAAFPKLGCGLGGLDWHSQVRPMMVRFLEPLPIACFVMEETQQ